MDDVRSYLPSSTVMMGVPTHYSRLLADPDFGAEDCSSIRMFTSGSAPLSNTVFREFTERTGHTICERYGMTETGIITSNPPEGKRLAGTVGYALPKVEIRVVNDEDDALGPDEIGTVQSEGAKRLQRLLGATGEDGGGDDRRRLLPHRRYRVDAPTGV